LAQTRRSNVDEPPAENVMTPAALIAEIETEAVVTPGVDGVAIDRRPATAASTIPGRPVAWVSLFAAVRVQRKKRQSSRATWWLCSRGFAWVLVGSGATTVAAAKQKILRAGAPYGESCWLARNLQ